MFLLECFRVTVWHNSPIFCSGFVVDEKEEASSTGVTIHLHLLLPGHDRELQSMGSYPVIGDGLWQVTENDPSESMYRC
jgi:hypothetical protein